MLLQVYSILNVLFNFHENTHHLHSLKWCVTPLKFKICMYGLCTIWICDTWDFWNMQVNQLTILISIWKAVQSLP